jgi:hypothetical protein
MDRDVAILAAVFLFSLALTSSLSSASQAQSNMRRVSSSAPEAVSCRQKYPDGSLVNKLSSEDGCMMYEFLRQDCDRQFAQHRVTIGIGQHCFGPPFTSG